ncbi:hypothetical protein BZA05DRAFT_421561 [Tricharina praecox]|uniref:uncharacterized protein n=1 Tax=Tricharina praecox TaxID=43433 RepID=UPI00221E4194|nr:uncharacterized protein BZA05DRAFT_421561 [Tricharina praecox]KAI5844877.1 hypothetical protein BZA05DRAFT_421561 [Tricharina praecox]
MALVFGFAHAAMASVRTSDDTATAQDGRFLFSLAVTSTIAHYLLSDTPESVSGRTSDRRTDESACEVVIRRRRRRRMRIMIPVRRRRKKKKKLRHPILIHHLSSQHAGLVGGWRSGAMEMLEPSAQAARRVKSLILALLIPFLPIQRYLALLRPSAIGRHGQLWVGRLSEYSDSISVDGNGHILLYQSMAQQSERLQYWLQVTERTATLQTPNAGGRRRFARIMRDAVTEHTQERSMQWGKSEDETPPPSMVHIYRSTHSTSHRYLHTYHTSSSPTQVQSIRGSHQTAGKYNTQLGGDLGNEPDKSTTPTTPNGQEQEEEEEDKVKP